MPTTTPTTTPTPTPTRTTTPTLTRAAWALAAVAALVASAACTTSSAGGPATVVSTVVSTPATATVTPVSEAPVPPTQPVQEIAAPGNVCPYITNDAARAAEGDRVGRVTLTTSTPAGCNFYWQYDSSRMILQIAVVNYPSQEGAYNAMIRDTAAAPEVLGVPALVPTAACSDTDRPGTCLDGVLFRTTFYPPDGDTDWACSFAVNSKVITVRTQQNDVSFNAKNVAIQIAGQF